MQQWLTEEACMQVSVCDTKMAPGCVARHLCCNLLPSASGELISSSWSHQNLSRSSDRRELAQVLLLNYGTICQWTLGGAFYHFKGHSKSQLFTIRRGSNSSSYYLFHVLLCLFLCDVWHFIAAMIIFIVLYK